MNSKRAGRKAPTAEEAKALLEQYAEKHPGTRKTTRDFFEPVGVDSGMAAQLQEKRAHNRALVQMRLREAAWGAKTQEAAKKMYEKYKKLHPSTKKTIKDFMEGAKPMVTPGAASWVPGSKRKDKLEQGYKQMGDAGKKLVKKVKKKAPEFKQDLADVGKATVEDVKETAKDIKKRTQKTVKKTEKALGKAKDKVKKKLEERKQKKAHLKAQLIRIAHQHPEFRAELLPLIVEP